MLEQFYRRYKNKNTIVVFKGLQTQWITENLWWDWNQFVFFYHKINTSSWNYFKISRPRLMALYCTSPFLCPFVRINFENNKFDLKKKKLWKIVNLEYRNHVRYREVKMMKQSIIKNLLPNFMPFKKWLKQNKIWRMVCHL